MLKIIALITKFILMALTALLFGSCIKYETNETINGSGNLTKEIRNIEEDFKKIEAHNNIDVTVEQSDEIEVIVETDAVFQKEITTEVKDGTLVIGCKQSKSSFSIFGYKCNYTKNIPVKKVIVRLPKIEVLEANSAATIENIGVLKSENISLSTSSAAKMDVNIESDIINAKSSSGSSLKIKGLALQFEISASSGSTIDAEELLANEIFAESSSGASVSVHPIVILKADASSGSSIHYNSAPKTIEKKSHSGGSIN